MKTNAGEQARIDQDDISILVMGDYVVIRNSNNDLAQEITRAFLNRPS